jgi:hypothetical protein
MARLEDYQKETMDAIAALRALVATDTVSGEVDDVRVQLAFLRKECASVIDMRRDLSGVAQRLDEAVESMKRGMADARSSTDGGLENVRRGLASLKSECRRELKALKEDLASRGVGQAPGAFSGLGISVAAEFGPLLSEWFGVPTKWELLYSASRDEFTPRAWHSACNGHAPTLSIVSLEYKQTACLVGCFTGLPWTSTGHGRVDPSGRTAIFALRNPRGDAPYHLKARAGEDVTWHDGSCGPCVPDGAFDVHGAPPVLMCQVPSSKRWKKRPGPESEVGLLDEANVNNVPMLRIETWKWVLM